MAPGQGLQGGAHSAPVSPATRRRSTESEQESGTTFRPLPPLMSVTVSVGGPRPVPSGSAARRCCSSSRARARRAPAVIAFLPRAGCDECDGLPSIPKRRRSTPLCATMGPQRVGSATASWSSTIFCRLDHAAHAGAPLASTSSSTVHATTRLLPGRLRFRCSSSNSARTTPRVALVSTAPRPWTRPSRISPLNGSPTICSTPTVSMWTSTPIHPSARPGQHGVPHSAARGAPLPGGPRRPRLRARLPAPRPGAFPRRRPPVARPGQAPRWGPARSGSPFRCVHLTPSGIYTRPVELR